MGHHRATPYVPALPSIVVIAVLLAFPVLYAMWGSLFDTDSIGGPQYFVGLRQYVDLFADEDFRWSISRTVVFVTGTLLLGIAMGVAFAFPLNRAAGKLRFLRGLTIVPYLVSGVTTAVIFRLILNRDFGQVNRVLEADLLDPMTEQIATWEEEDPDLYATVPPGVWEDGTYDGEIYHFPNKSLVNAIFYNIAMVEEAGVEVPFDSWWDVVEAARKVQAVRPDLPAYFGTGGASHDRMFLWLYNFGVPFEGNVPQLTSDQGVDFIDFLQTMHEEGITDPEFQIGQQDESKGAFVAGELPFISEGLNGGPGFMLDDFVYGEDWATTPLPIHEEDGGTNMGAPRGISMVAGTDVPYEASLVMRYLADPEIAAERYFVLESGIQQSIPVLDGEQMTEEQPFFTAELLEDFKTMESQIPPGTNTNAVGEILINLIEETTVTGTDEAPADIAARYQAELDGL